MNHPQTAGGPVPGWIGAVALRATQAGVPPGVRLDVVYGKEIALLAEHVTNEVAEGL